MMCVEHVDYGRMPFLVQQKVDAVRALRQVCDEFGDNDWEDSKPLGDVIRNHLMPYLQRGFFLEERET